MPALFHVSEQVFYFLHSFPRTASLKCWAEWCSSFFFCWVASNPGVVRSRCVLVLPPCSQTVSRAAALQAALKICCHQWVWMLWKDSQGSRNTMYHHLCMTPLLLYFASLHLWVNCFPMFFSFYCWMVKQDDSISRRAVSKNHCLHPVVVPYWTMGSLAPAKCTAQALCSTAHPNSASNLWIPIRVPWTRGVSRRKKKKAKNGEKNEKEGHKAGAQVGLVPGELRTLCVQPCLQNANWARWFFCYGWQEKPGFWVLGILWQGSNF